MPAERKGQVIAVEIGSTGNGRNPTINGGRQPSCGDTSRMNREVHVRICERLGVQFPARRHPWLGGPRRLTMYLATLDCATSNPSLSSSPWMRGAPQRV